MLPSGGNLCSILDLKHFPGDERMAIRANDHEVFHLVRTTFVLCHDMVCINHLAESAQFAGMAVSLYGLGANPSLVFQDFSAQVFSLSQFSSPVFHIPLIGALVTSFSKFLRNFRINHAAAIRQYKIIYKGVRQLFKAMLTAIPFQFRIAVSAYARQMHHAVSVLGSIKSSQSIAFFNPALWHVIIISFEPTFLIF